MYKPNRLIKSVPIQPLCPYIFYIWWLSTFQYVNTTPIFLPYSMGAALRIFAADDVLLAAATGNFPPTAAPSFLSFPTML
jgi:hypothetical protein